MAQMCNKATLVTVDDITVNKLMLFTVGGRNSIYCCSKWLKHHQIHNIVDKQQLKQQTLQDGRYVHVCS